MVITQKSIGSLIWRRQTLAALGLLALLFAALPAAQAQSSSFPILFFTQREGNFRGGRFQSLQIYGMNTDGSNPTRIGDASLGGFFAHYSPDGQKIVFETTVLDSASPVGYRNQLFLMNADGTNPINISNNLLRHHDTPAWSPDGSKIAFISTVLDFSVGAELWLMDADGSNQHLVYGNPGFAGAFYPTFSPDGSKIAFSNDVDGDDEIYVINVDGTNLQQLTNNTASDFGPDWSPDGSRIAFTRLQFGGRSHSHPGIGDAASGIADIYVMNADGSNQTRLAGNGSGNFYPIWSPDGSQILYSRINGLAGRNADIYVMNADGSNRIRLTNVPGTDIASDWLPTATTARVTDRISLPQWTITTAQAAAEPRPQQASRWYQSIPNYRSLDRLFP